MGIMACAGYLTPIGFHHLDYIDLDDANYWMECATLDLMSAEGFLIDGVPIRVNDCTPIIIFDATIDRMFLRECGRRGHPDTSPR